MKRRLGSPSWSPSAAFSNDGSANYDCTAHSQGRLHRKANAIAFRRGQWSDECAPLQIGRNRDDVEHAGREDCGIEEQARRVVAAYRSNELRFSIVEGAQFHRFVAQIVDVEHDRTRGVDRVDDFTAGGAL